MDLSELNKSVAAQYVEAFNHGNEAAPRILFTGESFAIELSVVSMIGEGTPVAARYVERGTFVKSFRGQEPAGKSYKLTAMECFQPRDGKIERHWGARDQASQARQIGLKLG